MKMVLEIGGNQIVMSVEAATAITAALAGAVMIEHKYVGSEISPTNYIDLLTPVPMHTVIKFGAMDDDTYGAWELTTKLFREKYPTK